MSSTSIDILNPETNWSQLPSDATRGVIPENDRQPRRLNQKQGEHLNTMKRDETEANGVPEKELPGTAGSPYDSGRQYHQNSGAFHSEETSLPPANCDICGCSIPPTRARCSDHRPDPETPRLNDTHEWSIFKVGFALVPATNEFHAIALGSSAFLLREGGHRSRASYTLLADIDEPAAMVTDGWEQGLPDAVSLSTAEGQALLAEVRDFVEESEEESNGSLSLATPTVYTAEGDELALNILKKELSAEGEKDVWLVPGVLYRRKRVTTGKRIQRRTCASCDEPTKHTFEGYRDANDGNGGSRKVVWKCLECGTEKDSTAMPSSARSNGEEAPSVSGDYSVGRAADEEHERVMSRLDSEGELH